MEEPTAISLVRKAKKCLNDHIFKYPSRYQPFHETPQSEIDDIAAYLDDGNVEGLLSEAIEIESKFINQYPTDVAYNLAVANNELGMCYRLRNKFKEAEQYYRKSLNQLNNILDGRSNDDVQKALARAYLDLAEVLYFQKKFSPAIDFLNHRSRLFHKIWNRKMLKQNRDYIENVERCHK